MGDSTDDDTQWLESAWDFLKDLVAQATRVADEEGWSLQYPDLDHEDAAALAAEANPRAHIVRDLAYLRRLDRDHPLPSRWMLPHR
jgi:hypothetical protein